MLFIEAMPNTKHISIINFHYFDVFNKMSISSFSKERRLMDKSRLIFFVSSIVIKYNLFPLSVKIAVRRANVFPETHYNYKIILSQHF
jgi:hypothetical protein